MLDDDALAGPVPLTRHEQLSTSTASAVTLVSAPQATLEVTTLADTIDASDGLLSLREAITAANASAEPDTITFADSIRGGTIVLAEDLPTITRDLAIDGDPLDGGAGGISIDGGRSYGPAGVIGAYRVFNVDGATAHFEDMTFGHAIEVGLYSTGANISLERNLVVANGYFHEGAALRIAGGQATVVDSTIQGSGGLEGNVAVAFRDGAEVEIRNSTIADHFGEYQGGIYGNGALRIIDSTLARNGADIGGTGISVTGSLLIEGSTILDNGSHVAGGSGISVDGELLIVNSTIAGTQLSDYAGYGAISLAPGSSGSIVNSTVTGTFYRDAGNYSPADDTPTVGLLIGDGANVIVANSIIDDSINGTIVSNGANTFRDALVDGAVAGDRLGVTAGQLFATVEEIGTSSVYRGVLADNGGPTPTIALLADPSNPALDAAEPDDAPATDQRGFLRDATPDIGAFELGAEPPSELIVTTLDDVVDATDGVLSLREAVDLANRTPGENTITFAESLTTGTILLTQGELALVDSVHIDGSGETIDAGGLSRIVTIGSPTPLAGGDLVVAIEDLSFVDGSADGRGGAILNRGDLTLSNVSLTGNFATGNGGAIHNDAGADLTILGSNLADNHTHLSGGAVANRGVLRIDDSTLAGNEADRFFGGAVISTGDGATATVTSSTFEDNYADFGGALFNGGADAVLVNSTITANGAVRGGGLYNQYQNSALTLIHTTVAGNMASDGGGGIANGLNNGGGTLTLVNSIVADSTGGDVLNRAGVDQLRLEGVNLVEDGSVTGPAVINADPRLGPLGDNGGPTETLALAAGSPALDAADPADAPTTDQRGYLRDATPDIGAFELNGVPPPPVQPLPPLAEKVPLPDSEIYGAPLFLVGPSGDAEIAFVDEYAAFQNSLGVYLVGPDGTIGATSWVFERIEHAGASSDASAAARPGGGPLSPGDAVQLSNLVDPADLAPGTGFGLFLVADGWTRNDAAIFQGGSLEFRANGGPASVTDSVPELVHIAAGGGETLVLGNILHTIDAGSANPLSNTLNPGGTGQVTSGLYDGEFTVAFEDKPLGGGSDRDFNDALFAVETGPPTSLPIAIDLEPVEARGTVTLIDTNPNDDRFIIEFDDNPIGGSDDYVVDVGIDGTTYRFAALIDGRSQLIVDGPSLQWEHFDFAAPGRHLGANEPTVITTMRDGGTILDAVEWTPDWPLPPPDEIRFHAVSSIFTDLAPSVPDAFANAATSQDLFIATKSAFPGTLQDTGFDFAFENGSRFIEEVAIDLRSAPTELKFDQSNPISLHDLVGIEENQIDVSIDDSSKVLSLSFDDGSFEAGDSLSVRADIDSGPRGPGIGLSVVFADGLKVDDLFAGTDTESVAAVIA